MKTLQAFSMRCQSCYRKCMHRVLTYKPKSRIVICVECGSITEVKNEKQLG